MSKLPLIGITCGYHESETRIDLNEANLAKLRRVGLQPVMLAPDEDPARIRDILDRMDGFMLSGGADIDPMRYGEHQLPACGSISPRRDAFELELARQLHARHDKPVLAICRGVQVMNVALGGTLWQDLPSQRPDCIAHRQKQPSSFPAHEVRLTDEASLLRRILRKDEVLVNTLHHQAMKDVPEALAITALAPDGIPEAVESRTHPFFLGIQWHPEALPDDDEDGSAIFQAFANAARDMMDR